LLVNVLLTFARLVLSLVPTLLQLLLKPLQLLGVLQQLPLHLLPQALSWLHSKAFLP
jgi:hypothetical protein